MISAEEQAYQQRKAQVRLETQLWLRAKEIVKPLLGPGETVNDPVGITTRVTYTNMLRIGRGEIRVGRNADNPQNPFWAGTPGLQINDVAIDYAIRRVGFYFDRGKQLPVYTERVAPTLDIRPERIN